MRLLFQSAITVAILSFTACSPAYKAPDLGGLYNAMVLALLFFWVTGSAGAWGSQRRYYDDPHGSSYTYDKGKRHHPRYDRSCPKHKQYRHYQRKHYRNTPSWKNYNRRLHYRFSGFSKKHYHGSTHRYDTDYPENRIKRTL
jgi:hypothetical protein